jgi:hypothetical protein
MKKKPEEMSHGSDIDLCDEQIICLLHPPSSPPPSPLPPSSLYLYPSYFYRSLIGLKREKKKEKTKKKEEGYNFNI